MLDLKNSIPIQSFVLKNGLRVVIVSRKEQPVVTVHLAYKVGSKNEQKHRTGMAHLFEHLMFEGTKRVRKGEFDKYCSSAGGTNNAYTTYDLTSYYMTLPAHQLELGLWLESDRMKNFHVMAHALENQKNVVVEEIKQNVEEQPYGRWHDKMCSAAYNKNSSYSWEVYGSKEHVNSVTLSEAREFHSKFYKPDNACLVVCGDVKNDSIDLIRKYFENIRASGINKNGVKFIDSYRLNSKHVAFNDNVPLAAVFLGFHCDGFLNDQFFITDTLSNILGSGRSSRLYKSLIQERRIASQAGAYLEQREQSSMLICYAFANTPEINADSLYEGIIAETEKIRKGDTDKKELQKSKNQVRTQFANEIQYSQGLADIIAFQSLFWNKPDRFYSLLDLYDKPNLDDVNEVSESILNLQNSVRVDVIPAKG
ncbi:MAG: insulinase family protein [Ignavibacteriae bacterium]|nr:insulinase family protein [Ignavibacteriota bacterium]